MNRTRIERIVEVFDICDSSGPPKSRFEHLYKELGLVDEKIRSGSILEAKYCDNRIQISLQPDGLQGKYPHMEAGLLSFGEALQGDPLEDVSGECCPDNLVDAAIVKGDLLTVGCLGGQLFATWTRKYPPRSYECEGETHHIYRMGVRKAKGSKVLEAAANALTVTEKIIEGSLLNPLTQGTPEGAQSETSEPPQPR